MSKKIFKRLVLEKQAELKKWADKHGVTFKTTAEIERDRSIREREQERNARQRGEGNKKHNVSRFN